MSTDEYVPSYTEARAYYVNARAPQVDTSASPAVEFDRFLARVRRDAVQQFAEACKEKRDAPGFLLPVNYFQDIEAAIRVAESYVKNYLEETP